MWGRVRLATVVVGGSEEAAAAAAAARRALVEGGRSKIERGGENMGEKDRCVAGGDLVGKRELAEVGLGALPVRRAFVAVLFPCRLRLGAFVGISLAPVSLRRGGLGFGGILLARARLVAFGLVGRVIVVTLH
jgi:hypothetical protein